MGMPFSAFQAGHFVRHLPQGPNQGGKMVSMDLDHFSNNVLRCLMLFIAV